MERQMTSSAVFAGESSHCPTYYFKYPWGGFHQHGNAQHLHVQIPKAQKDDQVISVFLHFWNLQAQKLFEKCWRNCHQLIQIIDKIKMSLASI